MKTDFISKLKDYFYFLKEPFVQPFSPHQSARDDWSMRMSWKEFFQWLGTVYLFVFILLLPIVALAVDVMGVSNIFEAKFSENMRDWKILLLSMLWAPFIEEMVFRYWLKGLGPYWWLVVIVAVAGMLLGFKAPWVTLIVLVIFFTWLSYEFQKGITLGDVQGCVECRRQFVNWGFYCGSLIFGFIHLFNYNFGQAEFLYLAPLLILPQLFVGTFLAWVRLRYSVLTGIIFHAVYNSIPILVMLLLQFLEFDLV